jgi:hypothetical protein
LIRSQKLIAVAAYQRPHAKPPSCRLYRPQDGFQQVVVVARASLDRERFDLGGWNPGLAHCPLHALDNGESIFVLTEQGDTDVWYLLCMPVSPSFVVKVISGDPVRDDRFRYQAARRKSVIKDVQGVRRRCHHRSG